jgi:hypothetical protein
MAASQNGWVANQIDRTASLNVPGTTVNLRVRKDAPGLLLLEVAAAFDRLVEDIDNGRGELDDWGYAERPIRGGADLSNHASGTAIDLNAPKHPLGVAGTFSPAQVTKIHEIIAVTRNVVRWGGSYVGRKDEMHFEINDGMTMDQCEEALKRMREFNTGQTSNPAPAPQVSANRTMKRGDTGPDVANLQRVLNAWYPWLKLVQDGVFGPKTEDAVKHLQRNAHIAVDGIAGPVTKSVIGLK